MKPLVCLAAICLTAATAAAQVNSSFTYQGELTSGGQAADGLHDLRFRLFDDVAAGVQVGPTLCVDNVIVTRGRFTVELDFGSVFAGANRFVEIDVRADSGLGCGSAAGFTPLSPRRRLAATPYAAHAISAGSASTASNALTLGGQPPAFYTNATNLSGGTLSDTRLSPNVTLLAGAQVFTGVKTFGTAPVFSTLAGAPFTVSSTTRVTNLNADLLDGLDSTAFAPASHTHDASAIIGGTLADARLSANIPRLASSNTFTAPQTLSVGTQQTALTLLGSNTQGTWLTLNNSLSRAWNFIASSTSNSEGAGKLLVRDSTASAIRITIDPTGFVGIGTVSPGALLELAGPDAASRIRNSNDPGGGVLLNSFGTLQLGLFNPGASAWGVVPAAGRRMMLGMDSTGRTGTLTNTGNTPAWRNIIDDGAGNATFLGRLNAPNMTGVKFSQDFRTSRNGENCGPSICLNNGDNIELRSVATTAPADGFYLILANCAVSIDACVPGTSAKFELKLEEVGGPELTNAYLTGRDFDGSAVSLSWVVPVTSGTVKTFKTSGLTYGGPGCAKSYIFSSSLQVIFIGRTF